MTVDLAAAGAVMATRARIFDRRRFRLFLGDRDPSAVFTAVTALDAYRNPDGGSGRGLEPDLCSPESQPGAAPHAFEMFEDITPATARQAGERGSCSLPRPSTPSYGVWSTSSGPMAVAGRLRQLLAAAVPEWRGRMTVRAVSIPHRNSMI